MDKIELIRTFIADEEQAFIADEQGGFYPSNHHHLSAVLKKIPSEASEQEITDLFYHMLRLGSIIHPTKEQYYPLLQLAYQKLYTIMDEGYPRNSFKKLEAIFLENTDYTSYLRYRDVIAQCNKYSNLPGMRSKPDKFLPYAQDEQVVNRIVSSLQQVGFRHNGPLTFNNTFWGFIFIALLSDRQDVLMEFINTDLPRNYVWILGTFIKGHSLANHLYASYPAEWIDVYL